MASGLKTLASTLEVIHAELIPGEGSSWVFYDSGFTRRRRGPPCAVAALRKVRSALHVVHVLCRLPLEAKRSNSTPSQGLPPQFAQGFLSEVCGTGAACADVRRASGASDRSARTAVEPLTIQMNFSSENHSRRGPWCRAPRLRVHARIARVRMRDARRRARDAKA